jgi:2-keto-4-pentenoate hydratase/2-oxohepta-3-ene-1,7-dioic acid hydratase in catechol pathway
VKLATFVSAGGQPALGCVDAAEKTILDLQAAHRAAFKADSAALASMLDLIDGGEAALELARRVVDESGGAHRQPLASVRLLSPVPEPRQIRDFNNFEQHIRDAPYGIARLKARVAGQPEPDRSKVAPLGDVTFKQPIYYLSNRFNVVGQDAEIEWPGYSQWLDYEVEFGVFIGRRGKNIAKERAAEHIFGYAIFNDFSARDRRARWKAGWARRRARASTPATPSAPGS